MVPQKSLWSKGLFDKEMSNRILWVKVPRLENSSYLHTLQSFLIMFFMYKTAVSRRGSFIPISSFELLTMYLLTKLIN